MKRVKKVMEGIGVLRRKDYDPQQRLNDILRSLSDDQAALDFGSSAGWHRIKRELEGLIRQFDTDIVTMASRTDDNKYEMQRASDYRQALHLVITMVSEVVAQHQRSLQEYEHLKETTAPTT